MSWINVDSIWIGASVFFILFCLSRLISGLAGAVPYIRNWRPPTLVVIKDILLGVLVLGIIISLVIISFAVLGNVVQYFL